MNKTGKKQKSIGDRLAYAYIRRIKKRMLCPACQEGKLRINQKSSVWKCTSCGYQLSAEEFEDNYVFWFCDECDIYLNNQDGFDRKAPKHMCTNCGYENDTTFENTKGICRDCGRITHSADTTLCADCRQIRKQKAKKRLATAGKVVGSVAAAVGVAYLASQVTEDDEEDFNYSDKWMQSATDDELKTEREKVRVACCSSGDDFDRACRLDNLRDRFDREIGKRKSVDEKPHETSYHREHGWYLPNDD